MYPSYTVPFSLSLPFCHSPQFSVIFILYIYSNTFFSSNFSDFCSSSPCGRVKWLRLQLQTLCMLKKDNNLQLVRLIVNFSVLMHLGWPYLCAATRNVNDIPPHLCPKPINHSIYTACIHFRNNLQSWWAAYHEDIGASEISIHWAAQTIKIKFNILCVLALKSKQQKDEKLNI